MKRLILFATMLLALNFTYAQRTIKGKITDGKGEALIGVDVYAKGTTTGTVTDVDGNFSLNVPNGATTLVASYTGFKTQEIAIGTSDVIDISMAEETRLLQEVVVTGSGTATSKAKLGISVETLKADKLQNLATPGIDQALVGKVPGAQISSVSGNPGDQVNIVLRGINSVQGGTRPMILLDGAEIPFANLNTLDMSTVERVEIVQGAASASLYGAQGANGVIQIFTKKGQKGSLNVNVSTSVSNNIYINAGGFKKADLHPYLTNSNGEIINAGSNAGLGYKAGEPIKIDPSLGIILGSNSLSYRYGTDVPGGQPSSVTSGTGQATRYGILDPRNSNDQPYKGNLQYYDHFAQVFQSAPARNAAININGGSDRVDYSFTLSNNRTNSALLKDNGYIDKTNLVSNIGIELFKNFTLRSITNLAYIKNTLHPNIGAAGGGLYGLGTSNAPVGGVYGFLNTSPFFDLTARDADGNYSSYQRASFASVNAFNPFYRLEYASGDGNRIDLVQNLQANYTIGKHISLDGRFGISHRNENSLWTFKNQSENANSNDQQSWASWFNGNDNTGELVNWNYRNTKINFYSGATFKFDLDDDLHLGVPIQSTTLGGFDYRKNTYKELDTWGESLPLNPPINFTSTSAQHTAVDYLEPFVTYGFLVDEKLDYGNKFGVSGGFRTDWASTFGAGSKPFTFPHGNAYLNLHNLSLWEGISKTIPIFKVRAAYGKAGIQPGAFDRYPVLNLQQTGNEVAYTNQTNARNPNLDVEVSEEKEIGTDLGFKLLGGNVLSAVNVNFTVWNRKTDNAIFSQNVPPSTGATQLITNAIGLKSNGIQLGINIPVYSSKNLSWDLTANFGHQESIITKVAGGEIPLTTAAGSSGLVLKEGAKIGQIYGYKALTSITQKRANGTPFIAEAKQGNYEIVNGRVVNKITNAIYFSDEATSFGDPNPTLTSSFINNITWKDAISLNVQFDWINGSHLYNQTNEWMYRDAISGDFTKPVTINGVTKAFTSYYVSAYYALGNTARGVGNNVTKDYFYEDASFVRLRNVSVGVDLSKFTSNKWLKKLQVVLSGRNLATWTKYHGMDPEISSGASNSAFDRGIDHSTIPNMKTFQASLNFSF